jgi:hypothetical protein
VFASTRYTKALEALRKEKKELMQKAKEEKVRLDGLQAQLEITQKVRSFFQSVSVEASVEVSVEVSE